MPRTKSAKTNTKPANGRRCHNGYESGCFTLKKPVTNESTARRIPALHFWTPLALARRAAKVLGQPKMAALATVERRPGTRVPAMAGDFRQMKTIRARAHSAQKVKRLASPLTHMQLILQQTGAMRAMMAAAWWPLPHSEQEDPPRMSAGSDPGGTNQAS